MLGKCRWAPVPLLAGLGAPALIAGKTVTGAAPLCCTASIYMHLMHPSNCDIQHLTSAALLSPYLHIRGVRAGEMRSGSDHLVVDSMGLQRSDGLVKECQVGDAAVVGTDSVICGTPTQDDGSRQVHGRPAIIVQDTAHSVCTGKAQHDPVWQQCSCCMTVLCH